VAESHQDGPEAEFRLRRIDHVVLRVASLPRALRFWTEVLGAREERRLDDLGLVQLRVGESLVDLVDVDSPLGRAGGPAPGAGGRNVDHVAIRVDPFQQDALLAHLDRHGVEHGDVAARYGADGTGLSVYAKDPDGNTIELKGPPTEPSRQARPRPDPADPELRIESRPAPGDLEALDDAIYAFNQDATGARDGEALACFLRDPEQGLRAGLAGWTWAGLGVVDRLFVAAPFRQQGLGTRLLAAAEREARRRGCAAMLVASHSFQAPEFYRRQGYRELGRTPDYPPGHAEIWLRKDLAGDG